MELFLKGKGEIEMSIKRLQYELHRLEALELRHILDEMASHHTPKISMAFNDDNGKPVLAVVLLHGKDTQRYLDALSEVEVPDGERDDEYEQ